MKPSQDVRHGSKIGFRKKAIILTNNLAGMIEKVHMEISVAHETCTIELIITNENCFTIGALILRHRFPKGVEF